MAAAAAPSSSSRSQKRRLNPWVYLSFRNMDSRNTIAGHLCTALHRQGIGTYYYTDDLLKGEDISLWQSKAIEDSRIAIVIFSSNFASSQLCLDDLAEIIEQKKRGRLTVFPIFYRVDPGNVWDERSSLCSGMFPPFENRLAEVKRWKESLSEAVCLSGWHLDDHRDEAELIRSVVKEVCVLLGFMPLDTPRYPQDELSRQERFNVFLSFMGSDVRNNIVGHLINALHLEGIHTFADDEEPQQRDEIGQGLMKAIEDSHIAVVLFSRNYASSSRNFSELEMILERRKLGKLKVKPVYYKVDPWEVRLQTGSYEQAFHYHEARGIIPGRIKRMREVLYEATSLRGWTVDTNGDEAEVVRRIVEDINVSLDRVPLEVNELRSYDVFLSFRGADSRHTIISHLYQALFQKGVRTFKDSESLESGESRSALFEAINGSRIAVIIFSENYAFSKWCLDELKVIMDCKEMNLFTVIPIFYGVSPEEVRLHEKDNGEKGRYQTAMEEMEAMFGRDNAEMVESWKKALWKGGDLIGFTLRHGEDEADVVRRVAEKVLKGLDHVTLEVAEKPVGMKNRLDEVKHFLHIDPHMDDVCMLGIIGHGGAGKTTLSKAILKEHFRKFDDWCFLPNIREESKAINGLTGLQQKLFRKLLGQADLKVWSIDHGKALIKERLRNKRVLVILDDVDNYDQFDALVGNLNWFGKRSRIVVTTRNRHVLPSDRVHQIYEVSLLNDDESKTLFQAHAFPGWNEKIESTRFPIDSFLSYAARLPLALVVLGKFLRGRSVGEWESTLVNLNKNPHSDINSVLKISFDGLGKEEKAIFLDIACFFKGWDKKYVLKVLRSCRFETEIGIQVLVERCLITDEGDKFQMHDLIEAMGRDIVREECSKAAGIPSRIWLYDDFLDILTEEQALTALRAIVMLNSVERRPEEVINGSIFKGLYRLRVLIVRNAFDIEGSLHLPRELRWFEWPGLSVSTIVFTDPSKIVAIDLKDSNVERIMGKAFPELKYLSLCNCKSLHSTPNLARSSKLEDLNLHGCKNLTRLDDVFGSLEKLVHLDLRECEDLAAIPSSLRSKDFQILNFSGCSKMDKLPAFEKELWFLSELSLERTAVKELPDSIQNLVTLKTLNLNSCKDLVTFPSSIYKLPALEKLLASRCPKLEKFPRRGEGNEYDVLPRLVLLDLQHCNFKEVGFLADLTCFGSLKELRLSGNEFTHLPACISKFENLEELLLCSCKCLVEVPELPDNTKIYIRGCQRLRALSNYRSVIRRTHRRLHVDLSNCHSLDLCNIDGSLSIEMIRDFGGFVEVVVPGETFPHWMDFQIAECCSSYAVPLPDGMSEDDVLGLALSVTFMVSTKARGEHEGNFLPEVKFILGRREDISVSAMEPWEGVHTWFVYLPRQPRSEKTGYVPADMDWSDITFRVTLTGLMMERCRLRVLCKQELDDIKFVVHKKQEKMKDEWGWESE